MFNSFVLGIHFQILITFTSLISNKDGLSFISILWQNQLFKDIHKQYSSYGYNS